MNQPRKTLSQYWLDIQGSLFPWLKEELGKFTEKQQQLVMTLELMQLEEYLSTMRPARTPTGRQQGC
jgi:hypothetical protein